MEVEEMASGSYSENSENDQNNSSMEEDIETD